MIYQLVKFTKKKTGFAHKIKLLLQKKLFYSSILRYMIVSNLKLNYTTWAFLIATGSFTSIREGMQTSILIAVIIGLYSFPLFVMAFMVKK